MSMTITESLNIIAAATEPANAGKSTRADYFRIQIAIETLASALKPKLDAEAEELKAAQKDKA
jgi:predicted RNase H-like nuclease